MSSALKLPTVASADVDWSNPNNIKVEDGSVATSASWSGHGGSGSLTGKGFGFAIPDGSVITGIMAEVKFEGGLLGSEVLIIENAAGTKAEGKSLAVDPGSLTWYSVGSDSDTWGQTWLASEINDSGFNLSFAATASHDPADASASVDCMRITVYWTAAPTDVPIREVYKVYNSTGKYLGNLPRPLQKLKIAQDINSLGSQITLNIPASADSGTQTVENYTVEDGSEDYTVESGTVAYTTAQQVPIISPAFEGIDSLIKNGNLVQAWIYNYWYPNGKCMFIGTMKNVSASFGGDGTNNDTMSCILYSTGYSLDNYIARGGPFTYSIDQSQITTNSDGVSYVTTEGSWKLFGQSLTVGSGITNIGAINVMLVSSGNVTVNLYTEPNGGILLGSSTQSVIVTSGTVVQFAFPSLIPVTAGTTYFIEVRPDVGNNILVYWQNTNPYAGGTAMVSNFGGGGGGDYEDITGTDLYFQTLYGIPTTTSTYTDKDPSTGMLAPIITDYNVRGGPLQWTGETIDATGLSLTYTFSVKTVNEALQAIATLAPDGFYYYVDLGTQTIYFKNASTTADFLLQKGVNINTLNLIMSIENGVNTILFTGGVDPITGLNLFREYTDPESIAAFEPLLDRKSDNSVIINATADAIGESELAALSSEQYQTTVTILDTPRQDITLLRPGKVVGFRGYGNFVDTILAQIVHWEWQAESVTLTLGILPKRQSLQIETTTRQLIAQQTQNNPTSPS